MKNIIKLSLIISAVSATFTLFADDSVKGGDAEAGKTKVTACTACHGADGTGINPEWPRLAGQGEQYLFEQLKAFKSGERKNAIMAGQVAALSKQDMADIAAYFASIPPKYDVAGSAADEETTTSLLMHGEKIFRGGDMTRGITACAACHGPAGRGIAPSKYPALSGQYAKYITAQLNNYRSGANVNNEASTANVDPSNYRANVIMRGIASKLTDKDIEAVSNYIQGLQP